MRLLDASLYRAQMLVWYVKHGLGRLEEEQRGGRRRWAYENIPDEQASKSHRHRTDRWYFSPGELQAEDKWGCGLPCLRLVGDIEQWRIESRSIDLWKTWNLCNEVWKRIGVRLGVGKRGRRGRRGWRGRKREEDSLLGGWFDVAF